ncbi:MAG: hypothetical protein ACRDDY_02715 [Clostridium sp.]|uniref:hypothetical protein n=1 Tax=Clostridium sp. TaxID=1506 RepID=UPI003EE7E73B
MELYLLTKKHYEIAKKNGLSRKIVYERVWKSGWSIKRAITEPKRNNNSESVIERMTEEQKKLYIENGLKPHNIYDRMRLSGLTLSEAVARPLNDRKHLRGKTKDITEEHYKIAEKNGINRNLVQVRYRKTGDIMHSITCPYDKKKATRLK